MKKQDAKNAEHEKIMKAILKKIGDEGIEYFKEHGELPPVRLTTAEMEFVKGGFFKELWTTIKYYAAYGDRWAG